MNSISQRFQDLRNRQECALIPYITAGDPNLETTAEALRILDCNGADLIELGLPYSDPLADGPVIQAAATRALEKGTKLDQVLKMLQAVSPTLKTPIILFTYYNPILHKGIKPFLEEIAAAGVQGLVVPDLPLEEAEELIQTSISFGIEITLLIAPTSSKYRIEAIAQKSEGFIYLVSNTGVTGVRSHLQSNVKNLITQLKTITNKAIGVGFGISTTEQAHQVKEWGADAVIVGSAFVEKLAESSPAERLQNLEKFCQELKAAITEN